MRRVQRMLLVAAALAASACADTSAPAERIEPGDPELYASYVQPYVEAGCATLDCHGDPGHALRLYSELGLRSDPELRPDALSERTQPLPLTEAELEDNRLAFAALVLENGSPAEHLALLKPLAVSAGGIHHEGPSLWPSKAAAGYRCLAGYLAGGEEADSVAEACARALDALVSEH